MSIPVVLALILLVSFILAVRAMKDFHVPREILKLIDAKRIKGTIVFLKDKIAHYH